MDRPPDRHLTSTTLASGEPRDTGEDGGDRSGSGPPLGELTIRPPRTTDEYHACEELQRRAWGFASDLDVVPLTLLLVAQKNGGILLGAFAGDGELHGFCFGIPGRDRRGRPVHCSHMLAVAERARGSGLGARLKWAQRARALAQGVDLMTWTYDPLESLNACFNFDKLGVVADRYDVDLYGETTSPLHQGMPTDRLTAKWYLRSGRVRARRAGRRAELVGALAAGRLEAPWALRCDDPEADIPLPVAGAGPEADVSATVAALDAERLLVEIPASIQAVKRADAGAAGRWREAVRGAFTTAFEAGLFARECVRTTTSPRRTVYLLERGSPEPAGLFD